MPQPDQTEALVQTIQYAVILISCVLVGSLFLYILLITRFEGVLWFVNWAVQASLQLLIICMNIISAGAYVVVMLYAQHYRPPKPAGGEPDFLNEIERWLEERAYLVFSYLDPPDLPEFVLFEISRLNMNTEAGRKRLDELFVENYRSPYWGLRKRERQKIKEYQDELSIPYLAEIAALDLTTDEGRNAYGKIMVLNGRDPKERLTKEERKKLEELRLNKLRVERLHERARRTGAIGK